MYKKSIFTHYYQRENTICAYNSLTMDCVYYSCGFQKDIDTYFSNGYISSKEKKALSEIIEKLVDCRIFVENDDDEFELINDIKDSIFNGVNVKVMVLHLSDYCNLKCKYCFIEGGIPSNYKRQNMTKDVMKASIDKYLKILERGNFVGNPSIVFYGGEPLFNWDTVLYGLEYIEEIEKEHLIDKVLITNGTLINDEIAKCLKEHNVLVSISMDGNEDVHNYNRIYHNGKGSFKKVEQGINLLRKNGVEPAISCVLSSFGIDHIERTVKYLLDDLKIKGLGFNHVSIIPKLNYYNPEYEERFADSIIRVQEIIQNDFEDVYERRMGHKINCFLDKLLIKADCTGCGEQISVSPNGEIGICQGYMGSRKTFDNSVFDVDYFPDKDDVFIEWSKRSPLNIKKCLFCPALATCGGGCPRNADMINGSIWEVDSAFCHFAIKAQEWMIWENHKLENSYDVK